MECEHPYAREFVHGAVVIPVPPSDVEQDLNLGFVQVNPFVENKGLYFPVEGEVG